MLIKTIIIDDEVLSIELLMNMLDGHGSIEIVGTANSLSAGLEVINQTKPDLVFLDINIAGENGFDLFKVTERKFEVIIASGFDYALNAFKVNATDYLLKPIDPDDLFQALEKVEKNLLRDSVPSESKMRNEDSLKIPIPSKNGVTLIKVSDIVRCEGLVNYTRIHLVNGDEILCSKTLLEFEKMLVKHNFFRIHKSHLINLNLVEGFTRGNAAYVMMKDKSNLQVSRRNKEMLYKRLKLTNN